MPLHLMRLAVGIRDIEHLAAVQKKRERIQLPKRGGKAVPTYTTHMPKRTEELLDGGSLYLLGGQGLDAGAPAAARLPALCR